MRDEKKHALTVRKDARGKVLVCVADLISVGRIRASDLDGTVSGADTPRSCACGN